MKFMTTVRVALSHEQRQSAYKAINLALTGHSDCNEMRNGVMVAKPLPENVKLSIDVAQSKVRVTHEIEIEVNMDPNTGELTYSIPNPEPRQGRTNEQWARGRAKRGA